MRGSRLAYSVPVQIEYTRKLKRLIRLMTDATVFVITQLFKSKTAKNFKEQQEEIAAEQAPVITTDASIASEARILTNELSKKFVGLFSKRAKPYAEKMVLEEAKASKISLGRSLKQLSGGVTINTKLIPKGLKETAKASIIENIGLIKSLPQEYMQKVQGSVMRAINAGGDLESLTKILKKQGDITERRAEIIASDQTRKAFNVVNQQRMMAIGVNKFIWRHSGGGQKPRKSHQEMDGVIFSFDDLPVINQEQVDAGSAGPERGIPGQAPNCGCTMEPVFEFDEDKNNE